MQNKGADDFQTSLEMKSQNFLTSACRYCRYYQPEGRRGGMCQQLGVQVQGSWKACALALPPFARSWSGLEGVIVWSNETPLLPASGPLVSALAGSQLDSAELPARSIPKLRNPVLR